MIDSVRSVFSVGFGAFTPLGPGLLNCHRVFLASKTDSSPIKKTFRIFRLHPRNSTLMGFRFRNLLPLYRSCISKLSHVNENFHPNPMIQALNSYAQDPSLTLRDRPTYKVPRRWHMGHSHHDQGLDQHHQHHLSGKEGENIFRLGLAADIFLASGKALTGYLSGSTAIIADAAHSVSDVVTKFAVFSLL